MRHILHWHGEQSKIGRVQNGSLWLWLLFFSVMINRQSSDVANRVLYVAIAISFGQSLGLGYAAAIFIVYPEFTAMFISRWVTHCADTTLLGQ